MPFIRSTSTGWRPRRGHPARPARRQWRTVPMALAGIMLAAVLLAACDGGTAPTTLSTPATTTPGVTISTEQSPAGRVLATGTGYTLYDFATDTPGHSTCVTQVCTELWPPLIVHGTPSVGHGLKQALVSTIRRPNGQLQAAYGGHPLYTWRGDTKPGMITGQALLNAGGYWYVVSPTGAPLMTKFSVIR